MSDKKKKNKNVVFELKKQWKDDSEFRKKVSWMAVSNIMNSIWKTAGLAHQLNSIKLPVMPKITSIYTDSLLKSLTPLASITENIKGVYSNIPKIEVPSYSDTYTRESLILTPPVNYDAMNNKILTDIKSSLEKNSKNKWWENENIAESTWLFLNKKNGNITFNWKLIWRVNLWTLPWKFFEYLYDNKGSFKTHEEIVLWVYWWSHEIEKRPQVLVANWKRYLDSNIRNLIESNMKWGYIIR